MHRRTFLKALGTALAAAAAAPYVKAFEGAVEPEFLPGKWYYVEMRWVPGLVPEIRVDGQVLVPGSKMAKRLASLVHIEEDRVRFSLLGPDLPDQNVAERSGISMELRNQRISRGTPAVLGFSFKEEGEGHNRAWKGTTQDNVWVGDQNCGPADELTVEMLRPQSPGLVIDKSFSA